MTPIMKRWTVVVVAAALVLSGCTEQEKANDTDRQRLAQMRSESFAGADGSAKEGAGDGGDYTPNTYSAYPLSKVAASSALAAREQAAATVTQMRSDGWTVISARCPAPTSGSYSWEAFAYRRRDGVPFAAHVTGTYSKQSGLTVSVQLQAPFHADAQPRFQPAPPALTATCFEHGDVDHPDAAQGSSWSL